ncbi:alpha/beta hydrolase fold domain-containing protein [Phyllobacterium leguminum]|uniref:Acetyl esterase/lipase n=1 Tax=Phyllobacterium leguminum TaxID=314237 RepID=A0A318T364_9HYPH|nr:alpha/beta hydrolase [Phyllobacterium leguminum]PYE88475.1 acetyl esterase/lipase [Phyllobacterium leguminum]
MGANWTEQMLDSSAGPVPVRIYRGEDLAKTPPLVLHLHGGAFLDGSAKCGELVASLLADAGAVVVAADYSMAAKEPFPAALQFAYGLLGCLCKERGDFAAKKSSLFVAGEEAGGNLAAGLALKARDVHLGALQGQILLSPMLDPSVATGSFRKAQAGEMNCRWADGWNHYLGFGACHPYAAPGYSMRLAGVAPALVLTAQDDPMRDESLNYARRLREAGVMVQDHVLTGKTGWPGAYSDCSGAKPAWGETVCGFFKEFFQETGALPH